MKTCPVCNSSKFRKLIKDGLLVQVCERCGFVNKKPVTVAFLKT